MDIISANDVRESHVPLSANCDFLEISCNWRITNDKQFYHAITTAPLLHASERINCEDVASLDTCIALQSNSESTEPCMLDIKVTNYQKIVRIAVVSEANVLEFFKQSGEYETTIFADFIDEFENNSVYLAETAIQPPTTEASIKFTRTKNKGTTMWIYGIRLILTDPAKERKTDVFNYDVIQTFLSNVNGEKTHRGADMAKKILECFNAQEITINEQFCQKNLETLALDSLANSLECKNGILRRDNEKESSNCADDSKKLDVDIRTYIDNKFHDMERRLMQRIDEMEVSTNQKLDAILRKLETIAYLK